MRLRVVALLALSLFVFASCGPPITEEVTIDFIADRDDVVVTANTTFDVDPQTETLRRRIDAARSIALANNDPWAVRFASVRPSSDSTYTQRKRGLLERMTRSVTIAPDDLQLVFADTNITVKTMRGDGWRELRFYPGTSSRATREQQAEFNRELTTWSQSVAKYFNAIQHVYAYMDSNPGRAKWLFAAILEEKSEDGLEPIVLEEEQPLVDDVRNAMDDIASIMDEKEGRAQSFAEEADLIFNPFPARMIVRVPGTVLANEGFGVAKDKSLVIETIDLFGMIRSLEGKWVSPDPLVALLEEEPVTSDQLAQMDRRATLMVASNDVAKELRARLTRPNEYLVRWRE